MKPADIIALSILVGLASIGLLSLLWLLVTPPDAILRCVE